MLRFILHMIGFLTDNLKYTAVFIGFLLGLPAVRASVRREKHHAVPSDALLCFIFSVFSVLSVLLFASLESLIGGKGFKFGAVSTYGVYFLAPLFLLLVYRKDRSYVFDCFAVYVPVSLILQRIRCIVSGCCYGKIINAEGFRWPVREAEIVFYAVMLFLLIHLRRKGSRKTRGDLFPLLMTAYGAVRFFIEFLRGDNGSGLFHIAHLWSLLAAAIGLSIYIEIRNRSVR